MRSRSARSRELRANALAGTAASPRLLPRTPARSSYRGIRLPREAQIVASPLLCYIGNANPPPEVNVNRWKASRKKPRIIADCVVLWLCDFVTQFVT
jgi:hypothetical protein